MNTSHTISLIITDDHQLFAESLSIALQHQPDFSVQVLHICTDGESLLHALHDRQPDFILLDLNMPGMNGLEVLPVLKEEYPDCKVIVVTQYSDPKFVRECIQAHEVQGYILKSSPLAELLECLHQVIRGHAYISKGLQLFPRDNPDDEPSSVFDETFLAKYNLTKRELEILSLIAQAKSNAEIADTLYISPQTVGAHRKNIMRKLNISTTAGLVRFAIENQVG